MKAELGTQALGPLGHVAQAHLRFHRRPPGPTTWSSSSRTSNRHCGCFCISSTWICASGLSGMPSPRIVSVVLQFNRQRFRQRLLDLWNLNLRT